MGGGGDVAGAFQMGPQQPLVQAGGAVCPVAARELGTWPGAGEGPGLGTPAF